jgi:hypothetical protein
MKKIVIASGIIVLVSLSIYSLSKNTSTQTPTAKVDEESSNLLPWPLENGEQRQTLLKYGMYVTPDPKQNPISPPERFTGYHTGLDIEIFSEEKDTAVNVKTICEGRIIYTGTADGYGGVVIQECTIESQVVSVLYGHINPNSIQISVDKVYPHGITIGELGKAYSTETGNTRKHLHLGMHKGNHVEFLGYVNDPKELSEFVDPLPLLNK